jgi:hypothetical protein
MSTEPRVSESVVAGTALAAPSGAEVDAIPTPGNQSVGIYGCADLQPSLPNDAIAPALGVALVAEVYTARALYDSARLC